MGPSIRSVSQGSAVLDAGDDARRAESTRKSADPVEWPHERVDSPV